ncbi:MAG TPA: hypothetical protein DD434_09725 [Bacteroidales bacterium]|nr:hypothetical protein [Bacteroidales bacterium]
MKKLLFILLALAISISAMSQQDFQTIKVKEKFSISLPSFLTPTTEDLDSTATIQYENADTLYFFKVLEESKKSVHDIFDTVDLGENFTKDIKGYFNLVDQFASDYCDTYGFEKKETIVNGMKTIYYSLNKRAEGFDYKVNIIYVEGKNTYYQVSVWIFDEYFDSLKDIMEKSLFTFKEL